MKKLLKLLAILTVGAPVVSNVVACNTKKSEPEELIDQKIVKQIRSFNNDNKWILKINKIGIDETKRNIKEEIGKKLSSDLQETFTQGEFNISDFFTQKNQILDNSYFIQGQNKTTIKFNFTFNLLSSSATINLIVNNNITDQDVVDAIHDASDLVLIVERNLNNGVELLKSKLLSIINQNLKSKFKTTVDQGYLTINRIFFSDNKDIPNQYFYKARQEVQMNYAFSFNQLKSDSTFNLTVEHVVKNQDIIDHISNMSPLDLSMNRNFMNGLEELKNLIIKNIEESINIESVSDYFNKHFNISKILDNGEAINDDFFKQSLSKTTLQFEYYLINGDSKADIIDNLIPAVDFNLTINLGVVNNKDIINAIETINPIKVEVNAQSTNGLIEAKNNIRNTILKELENKSPSIALAFKGRIFEVIKINKGDEILTNNYFNTEKSATLLSFTYTIDQSVEIINNNLNLQVLVKKSDQEIINKINDIEEIYITMMATATNGLSQAKDLIKGKISDTLLAKYNQAIKTTFDQGNFNIHSIKNNKTLIDDNYFNEVRPATEVIIYYTFGSVATINALTLKLTITETDENIVKIIKKAIPLQLKVANQDSANWVKNIFISKIKKYFSNPNIEQSITDDFNRNFDHKFNFGDFIVERDGKKVTIGKFVSSDWDFIYSNEYDTEVTISYGSVQWIQKIKIIVPTIWG